MKITKKKLMETVQEEMKSVLLEVYLRSQISQVLIEQTAPMSTVKIENLLSDVVSGLGSIDMSIDYLTSAITGHDPYSLSIAQKVAGRGGGRFVKPAGSQEEISETAELAELNPNKTLAQQEPEDFEEPEEDPAALKTTDTLGGAWAGPIDAEPEPRRPPRKYRKQAIELLATFNVNVDQQAIDAVAWQLYNNEMQGPTAAMEEPPKKKKRFGFFENMIKEELEAYLAEKKKYKDSFYKAKEKKADELMASGTDEDDAYGIADTIVSKQGKKKKKPKRKNK